jgi:sterol 3beta-glucosyltransferase
MKIVILTLGTRGDVQPYIALGLGLQAAGYAVTLGTSRDFKSVVTEWGLGFAPFEFSVRETLSSPDARAAFESKRAAVRLYRKVSPQMPRLLDDAWAAAQGSDAVVYHPKIINGLDVAEALEIPGIIAFYLPALSPTRVFPAPFIPGPASWGDFGNRLTHVLFLRLLTAPYCKLVNRWRARTLGLPPRPFFGECRQRYGKSILKLYGYSRHLIPQPVDWDNSTEVTGTWFLEKPKDWQAPDELVDFLGAGAPPVFVGFGSIAGTAPETTTAVVLEALRLCRQRAVIVSGWGGLPALRAADKVRFIESVPYDWLFPRVAAVVHHGGAGSTAEGLRAGKPTVVCPFFGDQPFWGRRVQKLGVGPRPVAQRGLTAKALAEAIHAAVTDDGVRQRAAVLGEKIRAERGVERAVELICSVLKR